MAALLVATAVAGAVVAGREPVTQSTFAELPREMRTQLDSQRQFVARLVQRHFPEQSLTRSPSDLALLQKIVDARLVPRDQTWQLQALGVVFGDALIAIKPGLQWWKVTDEFGTDPTLRFERTTLQINALTMISKRVERGEVPEIEYMAREIAEFVDKHATEYR